jgi:uncharacterized repeat protein (TIGR01451 family)
MLSNELLAKLNLLSRYQLRIDDLLDAGIGDDTISGNNGDDTLVGGTGTDLIDGGLGDDTLVINAGDVVGSELYDGGDGTDTLLVKGDNDISSSTLTSVENALLDEDVTLRLTLAQAQQLALENNTVRLSPGSEGGQGTLFITDSTDQDLLDEIRAKVGQGIIVEPLTILGVNIAKTSTFKDVNGNGIPDREDEIEYIFTVNNTGNASLDNVIVTDPKISNNPLSLSSGDTDNDNQLDVEEVWTYTAIYPLTQEDINAGSVVNTATVTADNTTPATATDTEILPAVPRIEIVKTGTFNDLNSNNLADVGETIDYIFEVQNTGNVSLANVTVTDPLLSIINFNGGDTNGDDELQVGEVWTYSGSYLLTQDDINTGSVVNTATVTALANVTVTDSATFTEELLLAEGIEIVKTGTFNDLNSNNLADVGETISYIFEVKNTGNVSLADVTVTDPLLSIINFNGGDTNGDNQLDAGEVWNYSGSYLLTQEDINAGSVVNTATVTAANGVTNSATFTEELLLVGGIEIVKTGTFNDLNNDGFPNAEEEIDYIFEVENTGNVSLANVTVIDPLLSIINFNGGDTNGDNLLDVGEVWTYSGAYILTQSDIETGFVTNTVTVTSGQVTDTDTQTVNLAQEPGIQIDKEGLWIDTNDDNNADVGETINYTFTVTNTGNVSLPNVTVTDPLLSNNPLPLSSGDTDQDEQLDVGEIWTYTATYTLTQSDIVAGSIENTVTVTSGQVTDTATASVDLPRITGTEGDDYFHLIEFDPDFETTNGPDSVEALGGDDTVYGNGGNDSIDGGSDDDKIYGGTGNDNILGGDGNDLINVIIDIEVFDFVPEDGNDRIDGGIGDDIIYSGDGDDTIVGGEGSDDIYGGLGNDNINGGNGDDSMDGDSGDDRMDGGSGNNSIYGGAGDDTIAGGAGSDIIAGGAGRDIFVYFFREDSRLTTGYDEINDYQASTATVAQSDIIRVSFTQIRPSGGSVDNAITSDNLINYDIGSISTLTEANINSAIDNTVDVFNPDSILVFTLGTSSTTGILLNDGTAGFQQGTDSVILLNGFDINSLNNMILFDTF